MSSDPLLTRRHACAVALIAVVAFAGCRALLEGDDLVLRAGSAGDGGGNGDGGGSGDGDGDGDGAAGPSGTLSSPSSGPGGAGDPSSTSTMSTTSTGAGGATSSSSTGGGSGSSCDDVIEASIDVGTTYTLVETNAGRAAQGCVHDGPSRFIRFTPAVTGYLSVWVRRDQTDFDSALSIAMACDDADLCANNTAQGGETAVYGVQAGVAVYVAVSGASSRDSGTFGLEATLDEGVCSDPVELHVEPGPGAVASFDLAGVGNHIAPSCGGNGDDVAMRVTGVGATEAVVNALPVDFDVVLHARSMCAAQELGCVDAGGSGALETMTLPVAPPTFLFVDSDPEQSGGRVTLTVSGAP